MSRGRYGRTPVFTAAAVIVMVLVGCLLSACIWGFIGQAGVPRHDGWSAKPSGDIWFVNEVDPGGPAVGKLQSGDRIIAIRGSARAARFDPRLSLASARDAYELTIERRGQIHSVRIAVMLGVGESAKYAFYILLALCYFSLAICLAVVRTDSPIAQTAFFLFLCGAVAYGSFAFLAFDLLLPASWIAVAILLGAVWWRPLEWALLYDFALRFPGEQNPAPSSRFVRAAFYAISTATVTYGLSTTLPSVLALNSRSSLIPFPSLLRAVDARLGSVIEGLSAVALLCTLRVFTTKYRKIADASARNRLRWVAFGIAGAFIPIAFRIVVALALRLSGYTAAASRVADLLELPCAVAAALVPITFTYAIVKHRVMGIRFTIRRGVQYLLARNVLGLGWYLPLIGIIVDILLHPHEPLEKFLFHESWWFYMLTLVSVSAGLRYRRRIEQWVDEKFFRSAYEEELILSELIERMHRSDTSDEVAHIAATKLEEAFKPNGAAFLYRHDESSKFTVSYAHEAPFALQFRGVYDAQIENMLTSQGFPMTSPELAGKPFRDSDASDALFGNTLVMPIRTANGHVTAVLLLGPKKSEEPYTNRDRKLLQAVATQTGLILQVIALKERIREEGRVRVEVLSKLDKDLVQLIRECPECGRCYSGVEIVQCKIDNAKLAFTLPIECVIDGKYRLERRIGAGGMGAVYEATDLRLGRVVAVKVLTGRLFGNTQALRRFEREARASARLQHRNIVPVYDFGLLRGDGAYLVMRRIAGRSWRSEIESSGKIKIDRAVSWFEQLCDAMIAAHSSGIIHRDLKPENLLISASEEDKSEIVTVLDFGLAKVSALDFAADSLTADNSVMGSLAYMSPEQRNGERVDARTDIFSCAVVMVETLSGSHPSQHGATQKWLYEAMVWANPVPACQELTAFLERCLAPVASDRIASMQRFKREMLPLLRECPPLEVARPVAVTGGGISTLPM